MSLWYEREELGSSLNNLYESLGVTKQGVHQMIQRYLKTEEELAYLQVIIQQVRFDHPTMGIVALFWKIRPEKLGRDRFIAYCQRHGFQLEPIKKPRARTTDSHGVNRFENLVLNLTVVRINQVWVSDITYYEIAGKFYYLTFILDVYSRYILGHSISARLFTESTTLPALKRAILTGKQGKKELQESIIFHSDGGGQYFAKSFTKLTKRYKMRNSMCIYSYENPYAERLNRTMKECYLNPYKIADLAELSRLVDRSVSLYNNEKPHKSLKYATPAALYFPETD